MNEHMPAPMRQGIAICPSPGTNAGVVRIGTVQNGPRKRLSPVLLAFRRGGSAM